MTLVLASASPRRQELLRAAGLAFETFAVAIDETPRPGEAAAALVRRLAGEKSARAQAVLAGRSTASDAAALDRVFIGADTAVVVDDEILGKPSDAADAARMLRLLAARTHQVMTGLSVRTPDVERVCVATTLVEFQPLSDADAAWYLASGEWQDKAGGYAIQGLASRFIPRIEGSYSNVVGLPVACLMELLKGLELDLNPSGRDARPGTGV